MRHVETSWKGEDVYQVVLLTWELFSWSNRVVICVSYLWRGTKITLMGIPMTVVQANSDKGK